MNKSKIKNWMKERREGVSLQSEGTVAPLPSHLHNTLQMLNTQWAKAKKQIHALYQHLFLLNADNVYKKAV